jgi:hypothetical protein
VFESMREYGWTDLHPSTEWGIEGVVRNAVVLAVSESTSPTRKEGDGPETVVSRDEAVEEEVMVGEVEVPSMHPH